MMREPPPPTAARVTPLTIVTYLFGSQESIRRIAQSPSAVWIGALFVLSAGFAREYDGEDLAAEPWHLLIPFAASLVTSFLLFACVYGAALRRGAVDTDFGTLYCRFLGLYWMTAPLAWVYALPVERWGTAAQAVEWNLWLLAIVSVWRVALMIRVVNVLYQAPVLSAAWVVCLFADAVAVIAVWASPMPVIAFMGGVRLSDSDALIQSVMVNLRVGTVLVGLVLLVGVPVFLFRSGPQWSLSIDPRRRVPLHPAVWLLPAAALAIWPFLLPRPQSEQRLRREVERLLVSGRIADGLDLMSRHQPDDFPPHWDPPPRIAYARPLPPLMDVMEQIVAAPPADWVRNVYVNKLRDRFGDTWGDGLRIYWSDLSPEAKERFVRVMESLPEAQHILRRDDENYSGFILKGETPPDLVERLRRLTLPQNEETADSEHSP